MGCMVGSRRAQFNFVWLFAIVAGSAILFLAVYGAVRSGDASDTLRDTSTARSISILTDPLQAGFADGSFGTLSFRDETRIRVSCLSGGLGTSSIEVQTRSGPNGEWSRGGVPTSTPNKYIFSGDVVSSSEFTVFSKPFSFPYEISDLIFLIPEEYCFISPPSYVGDELSRLSMPFVSVGSSCNNSDAVHVCFGGGSVCDMVVSCSDSRCSSGSVDRGGVQLSFVGSLLYGAIFSSEDNYRCNVDRLTTRGSLIAREFMDKVDLLNARDCTSGVKADLFLWSNLLSNVSVSSLSGLVSAAETLDQRNSQTRCRVW